MFKISKIAISMILLLVSTGPTLGSPPKGKVLDDTTLMEMESISSPAISPDGKHIVFTRGYVDKLKDQYRSNLWIVDSEGKRVRELTNGSWADSSPVWSPDGQRIAFLSDRKGSMQLHVMWVDSGDVAQLTRVEHSPRQIAWSPDGKQIAFSMFVPQKKSPLSVKLPARPKGASWAKPAVVIDRLTWAMDGRGPLPTGFNHIFVVDAALGGTPKQITSGDYNHTGPSWGADGTQLFFSGIRKPDAEYLMGDSEIYAVNLKSLEVTPLTSRNGPDNGPSVSPDGKWIAYTGHDDKDYTLHLNSIYIMDPEGKKKRLWAGDLPNSPMNLQWAADSSGVYFGIGKHGSYNVRFLKLDGDVTEVTTGVQTIVGFSVAENGQIAAVRSRFTEPGSLVTMQSGESEVMRELVDVNDDVTANLQLGSAEELWFESKDGLKVQGWLIKPANFDPAKKYPMVLWIHGGPWSMYHVGFNWAFQNFAAQGYAVLYTNPRGSTGYGQDFVNGIQYSYPGKDYDDLMAGVDAALAKGWIDERNMFVCGASGGGVLTAWIVGKTNRFAAAVSMKPVINWHSFVGTTDTAAFWYDQFRKKPWEDPMEFAVRSPLHYVGNVTTPTMVLTGEEDLRTPMGQSEEYYRALKILKKETLLVRIPGEYHGFRRPSHQLLQQLYLQAWFEKHKRGEKVAGGAGD